jgi:pyruvate kinase
MRRTKIVCTLGPACQEREQLLQIAGAGMDVARLNFSHGTHEWHAERYRLLREVEAELGRPLAVLQDLSGPKLRIGELPAEGVKLLPGQPCILSAEAFQPGPPPRIPVPIQPLVAGLQPEHHVFLDDGQIELRVVERRGADLVAEVEYGGVLTGRKGISAPAVPFSIPSLTPRDLADLEFGLGLGADWVAVSFVRRAADLAPVRDAIRARSLDTQVIART